ncbi:MAG TPA: leucyl aminopeptidase family protein, partial [Rudaea sp.]
MEGFIDHRRAARAVPLIAVDSKRLRGVFKELGKTAERWAQAVDFRAETGSFCLLPDAQGQLHAVLAGVAREDDVFALAALPYRLPPGAYRLDARGVALDPVRSALGWGMGAYAFTRYRKARRAPAKLALDAATQRAVEGPLTAIGLVRDLVNTPTEDMGPAELS